MRGKALGVTDVCNRERAFRRSLQRVYVVSFEESRWKLAVSDRSSEMSVDYDSKEVANLSKECIEENFVIIPSFICRFGLTRREERPLLL